MAKSVIRSEKLLNHTVDKYNFKSLSPHGESQEEFTSALLHSSEEALSDEEEYTEENNPNRRQSDIDASALSKNSKDALIESLMKKTDEMSSNFIKLQMKLESKEEEYAANLERVKEEAYNEGLQAGVQKALQDSETELNNGVAQFATSVQTLQEKAKEFEVGLENVKADLILAAIDIAKEVIKIELGENSSEVAKVLGDALIKELQGASKITLKVNPKDHGRVSEHVGKLENIEIVSDSAISEGGVVAISDGGNIDSQISKRFEKVKKVALSE